MARHIELGKSGETMAADWLQQQGYTLLHRNWCYGRYEIDVIASKDGVLHFIEVKTRSGTGWGHPEEGVTRKKISHMLKCSAFYQTQHPHWKRVQFDILSITLVRDQAPQYFLIEDIYL